MKACVPSTSVDIENGELEPLFDEAGLTSERRWYVEHLHYRTADWVNMVTTYSNVLTLDPIDQADLRARLETCIGDAGVDAINDALAISCTTS